LLLDREADLEVVGEASTVPDAAALAIELQPSVLVLDLNMPGGSAPTSLELMPELIEHAPRTRVVVLTMQDDPRMARQALARGAVAYVLKEAADTELVEAVRAAARGEMYLNPRLGALVAGAGTQDTGTPLTEREHGVLRLIALGHTNAEIGDQLYLSVRTIESHRASIQQKLGLSSRAELVRYALDHGMVE
jgi:two-component system response regulator NreC